MVAGSDIVPVYGKRVTDVLKGMLRPALIPAKGHVFVVADWAAIEARVNPWMSNTDDGERKLNVFRAGEDIYKVNAAATFKVRADAVNDDQRQIGKVQELSCGFAGGVGAFASMGRVYGILMPEAESKRMVSAWRRANSWAVTYWSALENAYTNAIHRKGHEFSAGRVTYVYDGLNLWYMLPSKRVLCYPQARWEEDSVTYAKASWKPKQDATEWPRARLWKGLACENITQAVANDLLRVALRDLDGVVLHIHDEIVVECAVADADATAAKVKQVMCDAPHWARGIPLNAEVKILERYGK
jgi:DNA polymerase